MNLDLSQLGAAETAQLSALLQKLQSSTAEKRKASRHRTEIKYLTEEEITKLFRVISSPRDTAIFRLAYHRGLRAREIGRLQLADFNAKDERLTFARLKGSRGGEYHLTKNELKALREWIRVRGTEPGPLFPSRLGRPISQQMLDYLFKQYGATAGLPRDKCHMHALKHSCGTHLLNRGEGIEDVQDHLGHRQVANTLIYAQYTNGRRIARDKRNRDW